MRATDHMNPAASNPRGASDAHSPPSPTTPRSPIYFNTAAIGDEPQSVPPPLLPMRSKLQLLSSLASPELKALGPRTPAPTKRKRQILTEEDESDTEEEEETSAAPSKSSRKEKSLCVLSDNFLRQFCGPVEREICLDDAATRLKVERRRIYDIVNVLEGLGMAERKAKNKYTWHGHSRLPHTLAALRATLTTPEGSVVTVVEPVEDAEEEEESPRAPRLQHSQSGGSRGTHTPAKQGATLSDPPSLTAVRKERSLGMLAQKFVLMFLDGPTLTVPLEEAAQRVVLSDPSDEKKQKTKVRRLYDIANILCSLELIEKTNVYDPRRGRRSAFKWIGMDLTTLGSYAPLPPAPAAASPLNTLLLASAAPSPAVRVDQSPLVAGPRTTLPFTFAVWEAKQQLSPMMHSSKSESRLGRL